MIVVENDRKLVFLKEKEFHNGQLFVELDKWQMQLW